MKKFIFLFFVGLALHGKAMATYTYPRDISNFIRGTLDPNRLNPSTVTMYGPMQDGTPVLNISSLTTNGSITASSIVSSGPITAATFVGNGSFNNISLATASILQGNASCYLNVNGTTQTTLGGLTVGGTLTATKLVGDGTGITNVGGFVTLGASQTLSGTNTFTSIVKFSTRNFDFPNASADSQLKVDNSIYLSNFASGTATVASYACSNSPGNLALAVDDNDNTMSDGCIVNDISGWKITLSSVRRGICYVKAQMAVSGAGGQAGFDFAVKTATISTGNFDIQMATVSYLFSGSSGARDVYFAFPFWAKIIDLEGRNNGGGGAPTIGLYEVKIKLYE